MDVRRGWARESVRPTALIYYTTSHDSSKSPPRVSPACPGGMPTDVTRFGARDGTRRRRETRDERRETRDERRVTSRTRRSQSIESASRARQESVRGFNRSGSRRTRPSHRTRLVRARAGGGKTPGAEADDRARVRSAGGARKRREANGRTENQRRIAGENRRSTEREKEGGAGSASLAATAERLDERRMRPD